MIGAFREVTLGFFDWERKEYQRNAITVQVEVLALVGDVTLAPDGSPQLHVHTVVGKRDGSAHGGHLLGGVVRPTLEVVVIEAPPASASSAGRRHPITDFDSAAAAARRLIARGPWLAAVEAPGAGDAVVSEQDEVRLPLLDVPPVDPTGSGDAFVTTLAVLLGRGTDVHTAAPFASAAAAHTAAHLGAHPDFQGETDLAELVGRCRPEHIH